MTSLKHSASKKKIGRISFDSTTDHLLRAPRTPQSYPLTQHRLSITNQAPAWDHALTTYFCLWSIALHFTPALFSQPHPDPEEDDPTFDAFEYEFSDGDYAFDVNNLEMDVYVTPNLRLFNARTQLSWQVPLSVDLTPDRVVAYRIASMPNSSNTPPTISNAIAVPFEGDVRTDFENLMDSLEEQIAAALAREDHWNLGHAQLFPHAFLHAYHKELLESDVIGVDDKVVKLFLQDGFVDLITEQYEPYVIVEWKIRRIESEVEDEFHVRLRAYQQLKDSEHSTRMWSQKIELKENEESPWFTVAMFHVSECDAFALDNGVSISYNVKGPPPLPFTNRTEFVGETEDLSPVCSNIEAQAANTFYVGLVPKGLSRGSTLENVSGTGHRSFNEDETLLRGSRWLQKRPFVDEYTESYLYWWARVRLVAR
jgi:hypothetical protein